MGFKVFDPDIHKSIENHAKHLWLSFMTSWLLSNWNRFAQLERAWNLALVLQIVPKISENYQFAKSGDLTSHGSKDILKNEPCLMN